MLIAADCEFFLSKWVFFLAGINCNVDQTLYISLRLPKFNIHPLILTETKELGRTIQTAKEYIDTDTLLQVDILRDRQHVCE